jgi:hypothetical protein
VIKCSKGHYCLEGSPTEIKYYCPIATYNDVEEKGDPATDCKQCTAKHFCHAGSSALSKCPAGAYCPIDSWTPTKCPFGTFSATGEQEADTTCTACDGGTYCPQGSIQKYPCIAGTVNLAANTDFNSVYTTCAVCEIKKACPFIGMVTSSEACMNGHVCPLGTSWTD